MSELTPSTKTNTQKTLPRLSVTTLIAILIIFFVLFSFLSGLTMKFYASFVFLFYALIGRMWLAVVCLGVFQIILMIPFRIINLKISANINEFKDKTEKLINQKEQAFYVKQKIRRGNRSLLFYTIDFVVQLTAYISIGRLFLTDFYTTKLNPNLLFSFVPYPKYPIHDTIFKIPYIKPTTTTDLGISSVVIAWLAIMLFQFSVHTYRFMRTRSVQRSETFVAVKLPERIKKYLRVASRNSIILMILIWFILRSFPTGWQLNIFSGDISIPNRTFNTITAIVTFGTIIWFGAARIKRKVNLAITQQVNREIINQTQKDMFKETIKSATFVGLGAYFITNHIPSAFELSIFTFELIALISPFTLDRIILSSTI